MDPSQFAGDRTTFGFTHENNVECQLVQVVDLIGKLPAADQNQFAVIYNAILLHLKSSCFAKFDIGQIAAQTMLLGQGADILDAGIAA